MLDQTTDATECFREMMRALGGEKNLRAEQAQWVLGEWLCLPCRYYCLCNNFLSDFKQRFSKKSECRGDAAFDAQRYNEAISEYSAALSLSPPSPQGLFIKRSKTYMTRDLWREALNDANEVCCFVSCRLVLDNVLLSGN